MKTQTKSRPATRSTVASLRCSPAVFAVLVALAGWQGLARR